MTIKTTRRTVLAAGMGGTAALFRARLSAHRARRRIHV